MTDVELISTLNNLEECFELFGIEYRADEVLGKRVAILRQFADNIERYPQPEFVHYQKAFVKAYYSVLKGTHLPLAPSRCGSCTECSTD